MSRSRTAGSPRPLAAPLSIPLRLIPGLAAAVAIMLAAQAVAAALGGLVLRAEGIDPTGRAGPISGITAAVLIGIVLANSIGIHAIFEPGLAFAVRTVLRAGIVCAGIRLSAIDVLRLGAFGAPVVGTIIVAALFVTTRFARLLGVSERLGALAAASTAICGITAAVSVAPTIDADEKELAYTVANVTLFGLLAMLCYPYLAHALFARAPGAVGLFLGTGIHDTSQVMGAALSYRELFRDELALKIATVTKLTRNVFLVVVVPALALWHARRVGADARKVRIRKLLPLFVLGFVAMAVFRSLGDAATTRGSAAYGLWDLESWRAVTRMLGDTWSSILLGVAMAALGLTTRLKSLKVLGMKPLYLGAVSAVLVAALALALAAAVGPLVR